MGAVTERTGDPVFVERMSPLMRLQHAILMATLLVLALTGFALMFHDNRLAQALIRLEGGVIYRGFIHRGAAVVLMALIVYHAVFMLATAEGRGERALLRLRRKDFAEFLQTVRFNLGMAAEYPRFGKYGYKEKFQYWGAAAGVVLIAATGLVLWAETVSMRILPKFVLDLTLVIHGYQGLLAFVILLFWHLYVVHLHPSVFPMNRAWLTGKVDAEWLREEHPLEYERLKGGKAL
jgi:formate dehydrogenase subunit gamma